MSETPKKPRRRQREPLQVDVTFVVKAGPEPEDRYTIMQNRRIPMMGSVFEYRSRIQRFMISTLLRVATTSPSVAREIAPGVLAMLGRGRDVVRNAGNRNKSD